MKRLLTSCFGLGWLPVAPGTWGSLPPAIVFGLLGQWGVEPLTVQITMLVLCLWACVVCVGWAPAAIAQTGRQDPGEVVVDEVAGQAVTFLAVPRSFLWAAGPGWMWLVALVGFLLFRLFDITKIWPMKRLEKLPAGWGILADDLWAGLYAALVLALGMNIFYNS